MPLCLWDTDTHSRAKQNRCACHFYVPFWNNRKAKDTMECQHQKMERSRLPRYWLLHTTQTLGLLGKLLGVSPDKNLANCILCCSTPYFHLSFMCLVNLILLFKHLWCHHGVCYPGALYLDGGIEQAERVFGESLYDDNPELLDIWSNLPPHPLEASIYTTRMLRGLRTFLFYCKKMIP